jgi:cytochrome c peroxidase
MSKRERVSERSPARLVGLGFALCLLLPAAAFATDYVFDLPNGFQAPRVPDDNPMTIEKVELGRLLFYDTRMSGNETYACASCHQQAKAFTDGLEVAVGSTGQLHPRNSMNLTNTGYASALTWANPIVLTLEQQALLPMFGETPVELGLSGKEDELLARFRADSRYVRMFAEAFPDESDPFSIDDVTKAIGCFERTLISGNSAYDRYTFGIDDNALSVSALRGYDLFFSEKLECFHCHGGFNFSASTTHAGTVFTEVSYSNNGLYNIDGMGGYPPSNRGLYDTTFIPEDMGKFKPPTLRNIAVTAPYMHDGSIATLDEVIDHYAAGGRTITDGPYAGNGSTNPFKSGFVKGFTLTAQEKQDVLAFLNSLTDEEFLTNPRFADPFTQVTCPGDCNYDDSVDISEVVRTIGIALGDTSEALCMQADRNADGAISITETVAVVNAAMTGCPQS